MDVLEVLVLLIALVLIALVVAVVLVVGQAMASGKDDKEGDELQAEIGSGSPSDSGEPLIQPAESVPDIVEEPAAEVDVAVEPVAASNTEPQAPVAPAPVLEAATQGHHEAVDMSAVNTGMGDRHSSRMHMDTQNHQAHRSNEERQVDSDRHNKHASHNRDFADDEIRRPAVEAGNNRVSERDDSFPYMSGGPLLSPIERLFYGDLKTSVSEKTEIFIKVRASDVINPKSDLSFEETQFAAEQLATQRFDFVLCDSKDFSVLCVIELDGLSEREGLRKIQREILRKAAESANVPVLLVDMKRGYTIKEIRDRVSYLLPKETEAFVAESHIGQHKRKIADLITEVDEPEEQHHRPQYAHSGFEEAENNSIHQFGNVSQQHQRPESPSAYRDHYAQQAPRANEANPFESGGAHNPPPHTPPSHTPPPHNPFQHEQPAAPASAPRGGQQPGSQPFTQARDTHVGGHQPSASKPDTGAFGGASESSGTKCPRCASPLKMSMATTGEFAGQYFWICTKLPECPYVAPITPPE